MSVRVETYPLRDGVMGAAVYGDIDLSTALVFRKQLMDLIDEAQAGVVLNLDHVGDIDSVFLGVMLAAMRRLWERGMDLAVVCNHEKLLKLLKVVRLKRAVKVHTSEDEAVSALLQPPKE